MLAYTTTKQLGKSCLQRLEDPKLKIQGLGLDLRPTCDLQNNDLVPSFILTLLHLFYKHLQLHPFSFYHPNWCESPFQLSLILLLWTLPGGRALSVMLCNANASFRTQIKANKERVCVCFMCVWSGEREGSEGENTQLSRACSLFWRNHIHDPRLSPFLLFLFTFLFISRPRSPFFIPISWFNCRDQQTYGQCAVARKCYLC